MTRTTPPRAPGTVLRVRSFGPVSMTDIVRYQGASGDMNPMHHDDEMARTAGYKESFSVGMLSAGYLATYCTDLYGTDAVRRFRTRFREIVWRGDVLTASGTVTSFEVVDGEGRVALDLRVETHDGRVAIEGSAVFAVDAEAGRLAV